jgi:flagellar basal-body rod modification protein FlgD
MSVNPISSMTAAAATSSGSTTGSTGTTSTQKGVDTQTFMKLLVAQLKNQDPLNPQDGAAFVAQLATFSSLEQLTGINQKMGQLVGSTTTTPTQG